MREEYQYVCMPNPFDEDKFIDNILDLMPTDDDSSTMLDAPLTRHVRLS